MHDNNSFGYGRSQIFNDCVRCKDSGLCIEKLLDSDDKNDLLVKYLTKEIDLECMSYNPACSSAEWEAAKNISDCLVSADLLFLIDLLRNAEHRESVTKGNIPQFSDLSISMYLVPDLLIQHENISYIAFGKTLFYREGKKDGAYMKYAENHCKLAALLDLAVIKKNDQNKYALSSSVMGRYFASLPIEKKDKLLSRLCLRIPIVQEALISNDISASINSNLAILSETTIVRRRKGIFELVEFAMN